MCRSKAADTEANSLSNSGFAPGYEDGNIFRLRLSLDDLHALSTSFKNFVQWQPQVQERKANVSSWFADRMSEWQSDWMSDWRPKMTGGEDDNEMRTILTRTANYWTETKEYRRKQPVKRNPRSRLD